MSLRFLADESCDFTVVRALRGAGYDVLAVSEVMQRSVDANLIAQAAREQRVLITEDKDFGWLVFVSHEESAGVILLRFPASARSLMTQSVLDLVGTHGDALSHAFVIVQPGHARISRKSMS